MQKISTLLFAFVLFVSNAIAQKVDLDKFTFKCSHTRFPENYVEPNMRTYDLRIVMSPELSGFAQAKYDNLHIDGYSYSSENPTVIVYANINRVKLVSQNIKSETREEKNKEGKVISTKTTYYCEARYTGLGDYKISGPRNPYKNLNQLEKESKKKDKKKEAAAPNPFLSEGETTTTTTNNIIFDTKNYSMSKDLSYRSTSFNSYSEASRFWDNEREHQLYEQKRSYVNSFFDAVRSNLSYQYGFPIIPDVYHLWILDSKSHPEYALQQSAIEAVKVLMPKLNGSADIEKMTKDLKPVLDYFVALPAKYPSTEKADKKMRYSAYYNLAKLYYLLDDSRQATEYANLLIKNDYDAGDGEDLIEKIDEIKNLLGFFKVPSRQVSE